MIMRGWIPFLAALLLVASCKKDQGNEPTPTVAAPSYHLFNGDIGTSDNSTLVTGDDNLLICGTPGFGFSLLKVTKAGSQLWRKDLDADPGGYAIGLAQTADQAVFLCSTTARNYAAMQMDVLLVKTDPNGDTLWTRTYGGSESDYGIQVIATADGNVLIAGTTNSFGAGPFGDILLIKVNADGDTLWTRSYPDPDQETAFHLLETQNGEYLVTGTNESGGPRELYLLKVGADGGQLWSRTIGPGWKWGYSSIELPNGDLVTCGQRTTNGYTQVLLVKTNNLGSVIWEREFGDATLSEQGYSLKLDMDGGFTITGESFDVIAQQTSVLLLKVNMDGEQAYLKRFGSTTSRGMNLIKDANDDNLITGNYQDQIFLTRTDSDGTFK